MLADSTQSQENATMASATVSYSTSTDKYSHHNVQCFKQNSNSCCL